LRYNIKFGRSEASDDDMFRVAKLVGIHEPIMRLPKGYDEEVRERGSNLKLRAASVGLPAARASSPIRRS